jgi:hypothetical protein
MRKSYFALVSILFLSGIMIWIYLTMMPPWVSDDAVPLSEFSTKRALEQVEHISRQPHFIGSGNHQSVSSYLETELKKLGLQTEIQEGTTLSDWGNLVKSRNVLGRIKGSGSSKALLLLSHYDSAPHSYSHGAADDASGIATILEGVRAFLQNKTPHKNDIIVLFSDAEELGLNGAALFVEQSKWAKDVGLALNFEARGTSGPSYMLMEVNNGNAAMVNAFADASPRYPVSNSLMYSIYKMLPNDTDLTVFRQQGKIQGFNFAFIDGHFNYHTAQDDYAHLSQNTLAHQGTYLAPLLKHFANADLNKLDSAADEVYFNTPTNFVHYSFWWNYPLVVLAFILFLFLIFVGLGKRILIPAQIGMGFVLFLGTMLVASAIAFFGWKALLEFYPQYRDILQGFTYNGHSYIAAFISLSLSAAFLFYVNVKNEAVVLNYTVAPLFFWLLINLAIAVFLPGAGFFVIPVFFGLLMFGWFVIVQRSSKIINLVFAIPAIIIFVPFVVMFPIGLGLKVLAGSALLVVLVFGLLLPIFGNWGGKAIWSIVFLGAAIGFLINAHINSDYVAGKAKPDSLLYFYDADTDKALWATYDDVPDEWTKLQLTNDPSDGKPFEQYPLYSKYNTKIAHSTATQAKDFAEPDVLFLRDSIIGTQRYITIRISPNRKVNRYDIFANEKMAFHNLKANGAKPIGQKGSLYARNGKKIISYYVVDNEPLTLSFSIPKFTVFDMSLLESSFDLLNNPLLPMPKRPDWIMPKPFVLNDAIVIKKRMHPSPKTILRPVTTNFTLPAPVTVTDTIPDTDAEN